MNQLRVRNCSLHTLGAKGDDRRGFLIALEGSRDVPFDIARVYYVYGSPTDTERGFHAHRELRQWLVCLNGSFSVTIDDGRAREVVELTSPDAALAIGPAVWREMRASGPDAVLMVLASDLYDESDYVHDYDEFLDLARNG